MPASRPPESTDHNPGAADREVTRREALPGDKADLSREHLTAELAVLADVSIGLLTAAQPEALVSDLLVRLAGLLRLDMALNHLVENEADDGGGHLRLNASFGVDDSSQEIPKVVSVAEAVPNVVARTQSQLVIEDVQSSTDPGLAFIGRLGARAYACFPLVADGELIGTLSFARTVAEKFEAWELALLAAFADQLALAMHRRRLVTALEAKVGEAEVARSAAEHARREAEVARAAAETARGEAAEASRAKSSFLATMSHELRTPINAMLGYTQLLELGLAGPLTEQQRTYLDRLTISSQHLLGLVNDVLDLSRIEADETHVARRDAWTGAAVHAALELVRPQAIARGVKLIDAGTADQGLPYVGDEDRVRQILVNLLSNAVKFTARGGTITVTCEWASEAPPPPGPNREAPGPGPWVCVRVADTGMGIPSEERDRIFEPFHQVERGHTRTAPGTGLGLAISRRLARLMGGDLTVESAPGAGSTFTLRLPAARRDDAGQTETAEQRGVRAERALEALRTPGLEEVGELLRGAVDQILEGYADRLRRDPATTGAHTMRRPELEDHQLSLLGDLAQSLVLIGGVGPEGTDILRDGSAIQRTISERHGARRYAQGWDEAAVCRDHQILREEVERTVRRLLVGPSPDGNAALTVLLRLIDRAEGISVAAWRRAAAAPKPGA